jgi:hypothetical protein
VKTAVVASLKFIFVILIKKDKQDVETKIKNVDEEKQRIAWKHVLII